uniref:Uncharacterized protein n=1 Tax=Dulem virus 42 TaxID=3145760 RepID=A0AAU8BA51_9CAUD
MYGAKIVHICTKPTNTVAAATSSSITAALSPITVHDTITASDTIRDTVPIIKYKTKYKVRRATCTHVDTIVSNDTLSARRVRKETPSDTIPARAKWYILHGTIKPIEMSETR